jgi:hypothetical protein
MALDRNTVVLRTLAWSRKSSYAPCALAALLHLAVACSRAPVTVEITGSRAMFVEEAGVITPSPGSREFLVIIELNPGYNDPDSEKMGRILRSHNFVSLRIREEPDHPPILVSDVTSHGEAIIRCKSLEEANHIMDRLHAWPRRN